MRQIKERQAQEESESKNGDQIDDILNIG